MSQVETESHIIDARKRFSSVASEHPIARAMGEGEVLDMPLTPVVDALSKVEVKVESGDQQVRDILSDIIQGLSAEDLLKVAFFIQKEGLNG